MKNSAVILSLALLAVHDVSAERTLRGVRRALVDEDTNRRLQSSKGSGGKKGSGSGKKGGDPMPPMPPMPPTPPQP
eukprot:15353141-Ditylum_brightwellii.AAC.1